MTTTEIQGLERAASAQNDGAAAAPLLLTCTLETAEGRLGKFELIHSTGTSWDREHDGGDDETVEVEFVLNRPGRPPEAFSIAGDAWRELESNGKVRDFVNDVVSGSSIELALRAQLDEFENHYSHNACETSWTDQHSCGCDDECPKCGVSISPHHSVMLAGLDDDQPARYTARKQ